MPLGSNDRSVLLKGADDKLKEKTKERYKDIKKTNKEECTQLWEGTYQKYIYVVITAKQFGISRDREQDTLLDGNNVRLNWNIESDLNVYWIKLKNFLSLY